MVGEAARCRHDGLALKTRAWDVAFDSRHEDERRTQRNFRSILCIYLGGSPQWTPPNKKPRPPCKSDRGKVGMRAIELIPLMSPIQVDAQQVVNLNEKPRPFEDRPGQVV
jgi:hypothetical protein